MLKTNKKGMEVGGLYQFVLLLVMIGMIVGVGLITLARFGETRGLNDSVVTEINNTIGAIGSIPSTWLPLIVTIVVLAIIMTLVLRSFGQTGQR